MLTVVHGAESANDNDIAKASWSLPGPDFHRLATTSF